MSQKQLPYQHFFFAHICKTVDNLIFVNAGALRTDIKQIIFITQPICFHPAWQHSCFLQNTYVHFQYMLGTCKIVLNVNEFVLSGIPVISDVLLSILIYWAGRVLVKSALIASHPAICEIVDPNKISYHLQFSQFGTLHQLPQYAVLGPVKSEHTVTFITVHFIFLQTPINFPFTSPHRSYFKMCMEINHNTGQLYDLNPHQNRLYLGFTSMWRSVIAIFKIYFGRKCTWSICCPTSMHIWIKISSNKQLLQISCPSRTDSLALSNQ